jgi:signal transduction histidine kinase
MEMKHLTGLCDYIDRLDIPSDTRMVCCEIPRFSSEDVIARTVRTVTGRLGRLTQALRRQQRFTSDVSHELRNPLAGLRAELEEAQMHPDCDDFHDVLDRALRDISRLESIVNDLLLLSRAGSGATAEREPVDLSRLVQDEVSRRTDRLRVELRLVPEANVSSVRVQIIRVLTNLLDNAQRHGERTVRVEVTCDAETAELSVSDDGEGIAEVDRERIFDRFSRLDAARRRDCSGTGLGLAIAREIAQAHHGTLAAGNSPSGGARFALRLPLVGRASRPPPPGQDLGPPGLCGGTVRICARSAAGPCKLCLYVDHVTESIVSGDLDIVDLPIEAMRDVSHDVHE